MIFFQILRCKSWNGDFPGSGCGEGLFIRAEVAAESNVESIMIPKFV